MGYAGGVPEAPRPGSQVPSPKSRVPPPPAHPLLLVPPMLEIYRPSLRAAGAIAVLMAWVASLGWLGLRRLDTTEESRLTSEASLRLAPGTVWYGLYSGSTQIGNAGITLDTLSTQYRISENVVLETANGAGLARASRLSNAYLGTAMNLVRLESRFSREGHQSEWAVTVVDDTLTARLSVGGTIRTHGRVRFGDAPTASMAIPYRLALGGGLTPGRSRVVRMIDSWPLAAGMAQITVGRDSLVRFADSSRVGGVAGHWLAVHSDSVRAYAVTINAAGGPRRLWIDHHGAVSGIETALGITWVRTDFDLSTTEFRKTLAERTEAIRNAVPGFAQFAATSSVRDTSTAERKFLVEHRDGSPVDLALLALLAGGRQTVRGDTLTIHRVPQIAPGESIRDTTPDPMIQYDAGAITKVQRTIVTEALNRERLPAMLLAFRALAHVDTAAGAAEDALGTLGAHAGRSDGIARLFVALLRASGVPSRYVIGVYPRGDSLLTHAWVEIWSTQAGGWYAVDPVTGNAAANTGLIRLAVGGSSHPDEMLAMIANARLTDLGRKGTR